MYSINEDFTHKKTAESDCCIGWSLYSSPHWWTLADINLKFFQVISDLQIVKFKNNKMRELVHNLTNGAKL